MPEILVFRTAHHVGAKADIDREEQHEEPAVLCEQGDENQRDNGRHQRTEHAHGALVQGLPGRRQAGDGHGETGPIGLIPVHPQGDAVGDGHRQCGLDGFFASSGQGHHGTLQL
ncbi:hypothetical protein ES703_103124 [subsurface metagenome]